MLCCLSKDFFCVCVCVKILPPVKSLIATLCMCLFDYKEKIEVHGLQRVASYYIYLCFNALLIMTHFQCNFTLVNCIDQKGNNINISETVKSITAVTC